MIPSETPGLTPLNHVPAQDVTTQPDRDDGPSAERKLSKHLTRGHAGRDEDREQESPVKSKQARRDFFENDAAPFTPIVSARDRQGRTFLVGAGERGDARMMFTKRDSVSGRSLRLAVDRLKEAAPLSDGSLFLDVGAEIGITAVLAIREHGFKRVVALEPNPGMYRLLCANRALNDLPDRIETIHVEPKTGRALVLRHGKRGWCDFKPAAEEDEVAAVRKGKAVEVESASIDELAAREALDPDAAALVRISARQDPAAVLEGMRESARGAALLLELDERVLADPTNATTLDSALKEHFDRDATVMSLAEDEFVSYPTVAELARSEELKAASVLALGA